MPDSQPNQPARPVKRRAVAGLILIAAVIIALTLGTPDPGGPDDGLLHLAGASALLRDGHYSIIQRPPLYSAGLALVASVMNLDTTTSQPLAQELGSITSHDVLSVMLDDTFLRAALLVNLVLWALTVLLVALTLGALDIPPGGVYLGLALLLTPSSWRAVGLISEMPLTAFLLAAGLHALVIALATRRPLIVWVLAGVLFALAGIARASFQLLSPVVLLPLLVFLRQRMSLRQVIRPALVFILPYIVIVGGWSSYNLLTNGVLGVSGTTGVALSTRTATLLDRAAAAFPDEAAIFVRLRDETYLAEPNKEDVIYWGARASNWLMRERGMSYAESNRLLLRYNLAAIRAGPLTYLDTVLTSLIGFHFPGVDAGWPALARFVWSAVEFALMGVFVAGVLLWVAAHLLARLGFYPSSWRPLDTALALALAIFIYTALVSSAVDIGKPEHRFPVQFIIPLVIILAARLSELRPRNGLVR